jgi:hypothetical protein
MWSDGGEWGEGAYLNGYGERSDEMRWDDATPATKGGGRRRLGNRKESGPRGFGYGGRKRQQQLSRGRLGREGEKETGSKP